MIPEPKQLFRERINSLLKDKADREAFWKIAEKELPKSIRCNTLKISPKELKQRLENRGWQIKQPYKNFPEIMLIENKLLPGELGKSEEHLLGYYYVQETASMMPIIALKPQPEDLILDLCAAPGSKTTQTSVMMQNKGTIIANDINLGRISILASNLEKIGCSNVLVSRHDGIQLCKKLKKLGMKFDRILVDVPCSGEGNIRSNPSTFKIWNIKAVQKLSRLQKKLAETALEILKPGGEMLYSTCTHSPEENELVIQYLLDKHKKDKNKIEILPISLPLKTRPGITKWQSQKLDKQINSACRIYPQDNNTEGFFLCKIRKND